MNDQNSLDLPLFQRLLTNLLRVTVFRYHGDDRVLKEFEQNYYLYPPFQPMLKADTLKYLFQNMRDDTLYELSDELGTSIIFFRFADSVFLVGPYVKNTFHEPAVRALLLRHQMSASMILSIKLYYAKLPLLNDFYIEEAIKSCISSFIPETSALYIKHLQGIREDFSPAALAEPNSKSLLNIYIYLSF